jgi:hypothetical protein
VCIREKERERRKNREKIKFFIIIIWKKLNSRQKRKRYKQKNALLVGHRVRVPCCPVTTVHISVELVPLPDR